VGGASIGTDQTLAAAAPFIGFSHEGASDGDRVTMFDLTGKVAVLAGANSGIGLAMASALAGAGCQVAIWGRDAAKNAAALDSLAVTAGSRAVRADICDTTDPASVARAFSAAVSAFGRVDGAFYNAGAGGGNRLAFTERDFNSWRSTFAVNLDGAFHFFQAAVGHMVERARAGDPGGRLIATSSIAAMFGTARNEAYGSGKAALNGLVRALAVELGRHGVTANAILPGYVRTDMTSELMANERFQRAMDTRIPMRRFGDPDDFAGIAVYLMSGASRYHTGDCLVIDGGYSAA
jgi:NAD(P)-dependent dehydrogenase (short-subunit alcohol dehydrogenase family)